MLMMHRIREAMRDVGTEPIGSEGKTIESDETFVGGKKKNVHKGKPEPKKHAALALVERGGKMRVSHVADVSAKTLRKAIAKNIAKGTTMNTDDALGPRRREPLQGRIRVQGRKDAYPERRSLLRHS